MTETSYTAWDDKLYQWPPPDGWYQAGDGKWWPEGYGPGPIGAAADEPETTATGAATSADDGNGNGAFDGIVDRVGTAGSGAADALGAAGGLGAAAASGRSDVPDALSGLSSATESVTDGSGSSGSVTDRAGDALSDGLSSARDRFGSSVDAASDAVSDGASRLSGDLSGADAGALGDVLPDSLGDALPDSFADAVPDRVADAVPGFEPSDLTGDATPGSLLGDAADRVGGAFNDVTPNADFDEPVSDDVGAALAETMSARADDLADPASSGISGMSDLAGDTAADLGGEANTLAADAAAGASQFFTADIPASDLGSAPDRPVTDLDALPPPSFDAPSLGDLPTSPGSAAAAADDLTELADPVLGLSPSSSPTEPGGSSSLFSDPSSTPAPDPATAETGDRSGGPSIGGFDLPPDETSSPPSAGAEAIGGAAAAAMGLPLAGDALSELGPDLARPDETMVAPLSGSLPGSVDAGPDPAETGQFQPSTAEAADWSAPGDGQFAAPPPQAEGPGAMPWGQAGGPGGAPVVGGLGPAALQDDRSSGSSKTLLLVGLGVAALVLLGVVAYTLISGGSDDDPTGEATGPGSLVEPHARTTPVEIFYPSGDAEQRFVVEVLEPLRDASGQADGAPPAEGERFAVTRVRVANQSASDASVSDLRFNAVTADGDVLVRESNACAVTEPALDFAAVLGQAGVAEGVVCWVVPADDYDGLLLGVESTQVSGRIHIDLR